MQVADAMTVNGSNGPHGQQQARDGHDAQRCHGQIVPGDRLYAGAHRSARNLEPPRPSFHSASRACSRLKVGFRPVASL